MRPVFLITSLTLALAAGQADSARAQAGSVVSVGVDGVLRDPRGGLDGSFRVAALVRVRFRPGLTPALGIGGFSSDWPDGGRMFVRTLMAGPAYRIERGRVSYSAAVVVGYAFGRLEDAAPGRTLHGAWALQPSVGVWYDLSERIGVRVSAGYLVARLPSRQDDAGIVRTTRVRADAMVLRVGVAYALF
jgi:hypothetical protein